MNRPVERATVRTIASPALRTGEELAIRTILRDAFAVDGEGFTDDDWAHSRGGVHVVAEADGVIVAHASVIERLLENDGRPLRAGYVEAVGTAPGRQGRGHGSAVMRVIDELIAGTYELGALSTGSPAFYERMGWERWSGGTGVRTDSGLVLTTDDDGGIMILRTPTTPPIDARGLLTCDWRDGDVW